MFQNQLQMKMGKENFLKKIAPEYAVSFCLLYPAFDKKRNVANSIKLSEMTVYVAKLMNNVTFLFLRLV